MDNSEPREQAKARFRFSDHPWLSLLAIVTIFVLVLILLSIFVFGFIGLSSDSPIAGFITTTLAHVLTLFVLVPFVLHLPKGRRSLKQYVDDIRLSRTQPLGRLLLLAFSCYAILALCQATGPVVYRLSQGRPVTWAFVRGVFDVSGDLPPGSLSLLTSFPSIFEEITFRGVVLTVFSSKYSKWKSIAISAVGFSLMHLLNLATGKELAWVLGQVAWTFTFGLFYGYLFVRAGSLLPPMIVHYLSNVFVGSFTSYLQEMAPIETQALYGVVFTFGVVPTALLILWIRCLTSKWTRPATHEEVVGSKE